MKTLIPGLPDELAEECLIRVAYDHLPLLHSVCLRWREVVLSPYFHSRRRLAGATRQLLGVIHSILSQQFLTIFDPIYGTLCSFPSFVGLKNIINVEFVGVGRQVLMIGRYHRSSVSLYDCLTGTWREGAPMPGEQRRSFTCVSDGVKQVYVAGGYDASLDNHLLSTMRYDVEEDQWETLPDMAKGGVFCGGAFQASKLYLIGFRCDPWNDEQHQVHAYTYDMEVYDVLSHAWSNVKLVDGLSLDYLGEIENCEFAIAEDGKIYCRRDEGRKLSIKFDERWEEFVDLPADPGREYFSHLSPWKGGLVIVGSKKSGSQSHSIPRLYNVYTLMLGGQNQNLTWTNHELQLKGRIRDVISIEI